MPEWVRERGIGETRLALLDDETILAARILPDDMLLAGTRLSARLAAVAPRPLARLDDGSEVLLRSRPAGVTEGGRFDLEIVRPKFPGLEPWKRALGRPATDTSPTSDAPAARDLVFPGGSDVLGRAGWDELLEQAASGRVAFDGGELLIALTPAMTVIDVDGWLPGAELAVRAAAAAGAAIRRLDLQGSIGIDFPSTPGKEIRQRVAETLDHALGNEAFERTAVNGFGFLQLVRPRRRASLIELAHDRAGFAARAALRRAAREGHGPATLVVHPRVEALLAARPDWLEALARQRGGAIALRAKPGVAISDLDVEPA
ncbi:ribonuclease E/G [Sphingomonas astaxanthinifaciens]|uniref:RNA-binding protein AU-1/Ribonuclease E/G domain-containing protein n=1 Tax=Sphingomonas astaxanthinifaciens DSM 22298 TaxID=1123267 RepID=A0ABQ5ZA46_9SPHN|nr:ribonuclease E/G [Sphingomonas astaxanthinifaciens]GLR48331.1 hypothetical protein GCM10007925_20450 [Sphingomonas astaxanthinifaciens DSM 22298]